MIVTVAVLLMAAAFGMRFYIFVRSSYPCFYEIRVFLELFKSFLSCSKRASHTTNTPFYMEHAVCVIERVTNNAPILYKLSDVLICPGENRKVNTCIITPPIFPAYFRLLVAFAPFATLTPSNPLDSFVKYLILLDFLTAKAGPTGRYAFIRN